MRPNGENREVTMKEIRQHPFFAMMREDLWNLIPPLLSFHHYAEGERILTAGEEDDDLFWIQSGKVAIFRDTAFGVQPIATLEADCLFGELSLIDGKPRSTDAEARTAASIWRIDGKRLRELFSENPELACYFYRHFWRSLAQKINLANSQLQRFFSPDKATPQPKQSSQAPDRPAWFAPPQGFSEQGSSPSQPVELDEALKLEALEQAGLAPKESQLLLKLGEEVAFAEDEAVFHEGDFGDTLYFILNGKVRISKKIEGIGEEALAILESGQFFGEMALVSDNAVRSADCYAHEGPAVLLAFRLHILNTLEGRTEHDFPFLQALCKMMAHRLRDINEKLFSWKMMSGGF